MGFSLKEIKSLLSAIVEDSSVLPELLRLARSSEGIDYQNLVDCHAPINGEVGKIYLHRLACVVNKSDNVLVRLFNQKKIKIPFNSLQERYLKISGASVTRPVWIDRRVENREILKSAIRHIRKMQDEKNAPKKAYVSHARPLLHDPNREDKLTRRNRLKIVKALKPIKPLPIVEYEDNRLTPSQIDRSTDHTQEKQIRRILERQSDRKCIPASFNALIPSRFQENAK